MKISISKAATPFLDRTTNIVERKGLGHPDTLCDQISELISRKLSQYYVDETGAIQHHNLDKVMLVGGESETGFGSGKIIHPIELIVAGRATLDCNGPVPIEQIVKEASEEIFNAVLPRLDTNRDLIRTIKVKPGSPELRTTFEADRETPLANDTSIGIGYAPLATLEKKILDLSDHLCADKTRIKLSGLGTDIKLMGLRQESHIKITIAAATIGPLLKDKKVYNSLKESIKEETKKFLKLNKEAEIHVNTADIPSKNSFYLTTTGSSVEMGDDGMTGRGNRHTGLITPFRVISMEATAGKNPVNHVGKLYNITARLIAEDLAEKDGISEATCVLVSQIGKPITKPQYISIKLSHELSQKEIEETADEIVAHRLKQLPEIWKGLLEGKYRLF